MKKFTYILLLVLILLFGTACANNGLPESNLPESNLPESRTFIVTDRTSFEKIISEDFAEFEVDFDNEMIIVYTFETMYVLPAKIADIELSGKTLTLNYNIELIPATGSARAPFQRWFIVKSDKLDITSVENSVGYVYTDEENSTEENLPYNAQLYDNCGLWIKQSFQNKNRIKGAIYYDD